jgi:hypothetical protein
VLQQGADDGLSGRELGIHGDEKLESFGVDISDLDTTLAVTQSEA